jgi:hypothetical protein
MITLAEFLYLENVNETQSQTLLQTYTGLKFESPSDFRTFFNQEGIQLRKDIVDTKTEKTLLLERFKSFRGSVDYSNARRFIEEQLRLNKRIKDIQNTGGTIESVSSILNGISQEPVDPFFNFVIRKILTGSESGTLPSEELRVILDRLLQESTREYYDESSDLVRDSSDRIQSFKNIFKNKGRIRVPILDERFLLSDFRYIIDSSFSSLPTATNAERNVLDKIAAAVASGDPLADQFLSDLNNLILSDPNSVAGLNARIKELEREIEVKQATIETRLIKEIEHEQYIDSIATDNLQKEVQLEAKDQTITELTNTIDTKLKDIESSVQSQISTISTAIDTLSQSVVSQANAANASQDAEISELKTKLAELDKLKTEIEELKNKV